MHSFSDELIAIQDEGLYRRLRTLPTVGGSFEWDGRRILNFSSNDYLDLARAKALKAAAHAAIDTYGCGATASRLMAGQTDIHARLEQRLAAWLGTESALVFGTGFQANLGVLTALTGPGDLIFSDRLNHASLIDGCRLSKAEVHRFEHNDLDHLESLLNAHTTRGRRFIVTESLFSMDGDTAPLHGLRALADRYDAMLVVDEAHALGVFGPNGSGVCRDEEIVPDVLIGTLGKSLGGFGGFVAGARTMIELLINRARSFIYSTGLPPASVATAIAAIDVLHAQPDLGATLRAKASRLRAMLRARALEVPDDASQILPVLLGGNDVVMRVAQDVFDAGIIATGIRPPTVPPGTERLRLSVTLAHDDADLERAADSIASAVQRAATSVTP